MLLLVAPVHATTLVKSSSLGQDAVRQAVQSMAPLVPVQWAADLYHGALIGLERQVIASSLRAAFVTLGASGAILVLAMLSPSILAYFV